MSHPSKFVQYATTVLDCECPAFWYRPHRPCKHIRRLAEATATLAEWRDAQRYLANGAGRYAGKGIRKVSLRP